MGIEIKDTVLLVCNIESSTADFVSLILQQDVFPRALEVGAAALDSFHEGVRIVRLESRAEVDRFIQKHRSRLLGVFIEEDLRLGNGTEIAQNIATSGTTNVNLLTVEQFITEPAVTEGGVDVLTPLEVPGVKVIEISEGFADRIIALFKEELAGKGST